MQKSIPDRPKNSRFIATKMVVKNKIERLARLRLIPVVPERIVPAAAAGHLLGRQAEEKEVFFPSLLSHLDRGPVASANGQSAVHHELPIASAAGFVAGGRNLLGDVARRDQPFG